MESVVNPLKDFAKNSIRLVKRCTKPDRKGVSAVLATSTVAAEVSRAPCKFADFAQVVALAGRVQQDHGPHSVGLHSDGLHRLLRQAHIYSERLRCAAPRWPVSLLTQWPNAVSVSSQPINQIIVGGAAA